jgi:iron complex outermembrane receptor protein
VSGSGQKTVTGIPVVQNLSGATMPNSPKVKFTVSADQRIPLPGPVDIALDASYTWRDRTQMLVDQNPYGFQGSFGILNLSAGVADKGGHYSITAFVNNVFNKVYYTDIEDFWSSPWGGTDTVVGQPARDAHVYGGLRANYKF